MNNETFFNEIYINYFNEKEALNNRILYAIEELNKIQFNNKNRALDLGAGHGAYTFALADIGFSEIIAIDYSEKLLKCLQSEIKRNQTIKTINADFNKLSELELNKFEFVNITGDSILYVENKNDISGLLNNVFNLLSPKGLLFIEFRDFSKTEEILSRFRVIQQTDDISKIIAINYEDEFVYTVDLINRKVNGRWVFEKGMNKKVRVSKGEMIEILEYIGFEIVNNFEQNGLVKLLSKRSN